MPSLFKSKKSQQVNSSSSNARGSASAGSSQQEFSDVNKRDAFKRALKDVLKDRLNTSEDFGDIAIPNFPPEFANEEVRQVPIHALTNSTEPGQLDRLTDAIFAFDECRDIRVELDGYQKSLATLLEDVTKTRKAMNAFNPSRVYRFNNQRNKHLDAFQYCDTILSKAQQCRASEDLNTLLSVIDTALHSPERDEFEQLLMSVRARVANYMPPPEYVFDNSTKGDTSKEKLTIPHPIHESSINDLALGEEEMRISKFVLTAMKNSLTNPPGLSDEASTAASVCLHTPELGAKLAQKALDKAKLADRTAELRSLAKEIEGLADDLDDFKSFVSKNSHDSSYLPKSTTEKVMRSLLPLRWQEGAKYIFHGGASSTVSGLTETAKGLLQFLTKIVTDRTLSNPLSQLADRLQEMQNGNIPRSTIEWAASFGSGGLAEEGAEEEGAED